MKGSVALLPLLFAVTGCNLYWGGGGGGGDDKCEPTPGGGISAAYIDPTTGVCTSNPSYNCPCGEECAEPAQVIGPSCSGPCEALDETDCLATAGCHAAYNTGDNSGSGSGGITPDKTPVMPGGPLGFSACWDINPLPVVEGGGCVGLDPFTCAEHDDCVTDFSVDPSTGAETATCADENGTTACNLDCAMGYSCGVTCDSAGSCIEGCIANGQIGTCDTSQIKCNSAPPKCPAGSEPGVFDNCWSGYCIPDDECTNNCMSYTTESDCLGNSCTAVYVGTDCTCTSAGDCSCEDETFESCE